MTTRTRLAVTQQEQAHHVNSTKQHIKRCQLTRGGDAGWRSMMDQEPALHPLMTTSPQPPFFSEAPLWVLHQQRSSSKKRPAAPPQRQQQDKKEGCLRIMLLSGVLVVLRASGHCWWSLLVVIAGGHCWWSVLVASAGGQCWWSVLVVSAGGQCWWSVLVVSAGGQGWWSGLVVSAAGQCCWAVLLGSAAGQCCWAVLLGSAAGQSSRHSQQHGGIALNMVLLSEMSCTLPDTHGKQPLATRSNLVASWCTTSLPVADCELSSQQQQ
jgi:hypothetical protein